MEKPTWENRARKVPWEIYLSGRQKDRGSIYLFVNQFTLRSIRAGQKNIYYHNRSRVLVSNKALDAFVKTLVINVLNNKTIILLNLAEYRLILAN